MTARKKLLITGAAGEIGCVLRAGLYDVYTLGFLECAVWNKVQN